MQKTTNYTAEIFDALTKGNFICSNSTDPLQSLLYTVIDEDFDQLFTYFSSINFILERGDEYFYFSRTESKASIESKIEHAFAWIDLVDFFITYDNGFAPGFRFTPSDIQQQVKVDVSLKDKLEIMKRLTGDGSYAERINNLIKNHLVKNGYAELENELTNQYKVLASFNYIKQLIISIQIQEETANEIPE